MILKVFYTNSSITFTDNIGNVTPGSQVINVASRDDISSQTTKMAQKVQTCKQLSVVSPYLSQLFDSFVSNFRKVEAAGGIVTDSQQRLLMIFRRGKWDMAKGKLEAGEQIRECALREVSEECALDLEGLEITGEQPTTTYHIYRDPFVGDMVIKPTHWYVMRYSGSAELKPQIEEGIEKVEWLTKEQVKERLPLTHKTLVDIITEKYINHD